MAETEEELSDSSGLTEANDPPVEDTAKTESITPVKPSTDVEPSPDVTTTDESSTDTQP